MSRTAFTTMEASLADPSTICPMSPFHSPNLLPADGVATTLTLSWMSTVAGDVAFPPTVTVPEPSHAVVIAAVSSARASVGTRSGPSLALHVSCVSLSAFFHTRTSSYVAEASLSL